MARVSDSIKLGVGIDGVCQPRLIVAVVVEFEDDLTRSLAGIGDKMAYISGIIVSKHTSNGRIMTFDSPAFVEKFASTLIHSLSSLIGTSSIRKREIPSLSCLLGIM